MSITPSPTPWLYASGVALIGLGASLVWRRRKLADATTRAQNRTTLAGGITAFLVGSVIIASAIIIDVDRYRAAHTQTFIYSLEVHPVGPVPVRLYLPAPVDPRLTGSFEFSNGTSTLGYESDGFGGSVVANVSGNVSFSITLTLQGSFLDETLTRVSGRQFTSPDQGNRNVSVELVGSDPVNSGARVVLYISFGGFCSATTLAMEALVSPGTATYPATLLSASC